MKHLKLKNRKIIFSISIVCVSLFLMFFFRYEETGVYDYNGGKVKIKMDLLRLKIPFWDPWDYDYGVTTSDLYYVVYLDKKQIFRFIGKKSSESCVTVFEECSYIENNNFFIFYRGQGFFLKIIIPLDGKKYLLKDLGITAYEDNGSITCEGLRNGSGNSIYEKCTSEKTDFILKWEVVDY